SRRRPFPAGTDLAARPRFPPASGAEFFMRPFVIALPAAALALALASAPLRAHGGIWRPAGGGPTRPTGARAPAAPRGRGRGAPARRAPAGCGAPSRGGRRGVSSSGGPPPRPTPPPATSAS